MHIPPAKTYKLPLLDRLWWNEAITHCPFDRTHAMIRVLHVIPAVAPRYGGPSTAIWPMTRALREGGNCEVEIASTDADGPDTRLALADVPDAQGVHLFHREGGEQHKYSPELGRWLAVHAREFDVIHTHSNWNYPVAAACRAAKRFGVPYVIRPCGMLSNYTFARSKWKKRAYWWLRERANVFGAASFHATSEDERREVLRLGVRVPVEVIPHGISAEAWQAPVEPNWLRKQCPQAGDRPIILFLSRLHPKKGVVDLLLPAMARLRSDAFLAIAGGEDDRAPAYAAEVQRHVTQFGLTEKVSLLGPVSPDRRWAAFDGADLFVLPSHSENFGIVVAEAMARGKPVVVTTGVQFASHVNASQGGSIVRPDVGEIAASLDQWLVNPAERKKAGSLARAYVCDRLSWRRAAEQFVDLYRQVCGNRLHTAGNTDD